MLAQILEFQSLQQYSVTHQQYNGSSVVNWHYNQPEVTDNMTVALLANGLKIVHERLIKRKKACADFQKCPAFATVPSTRSVTY